MEHTKSGWPCLRSPRWSYGLSGPFWACEQKRLHRGCFQWDTLIPWTVRIPTVPSNQTQGSNPKPYPPLELDPPSSNWEKCQDAAYFYVQRADKNEAREQGLHSVHSPSHTPKLTRDWLELWVSSQKSLGFIGGGNDVLPVWCSG